MAFNNGIHGWCYTACESCGKKVECAPMGRYDCTREKCGNIGNKPRSKYAPCAYLTMVINLCGKRADQVAKEEMGWSNSLENSESIANCQIECHDHVDLAIEEDYVSTRTPSKRNVGDQASRPSGVDEAKLEGQLSTNKFSRRGVKN
ncbi:hypothetical protein PIB30_033045 [Stylosanthes scabra]|uniref:Uncharacterized protein n=1 Tax=Stylosanthes scabra TaxID=79078 RepID=A0ABU6YAY9_9FABA|nr:hypothetical protein [Stylosanthes scabra]